MLLNRERADAVMEDQKIDVIVAATTENVTYTTGFATEAARRNRRTQFYGVLPRGRVPTLILPILELCIVVDERPDVSRIATHGSFHLVAPESASIGSEERAWLELQARCPSSATPLDALVGELHFFGLGDGRIAIDEQGFLPSVRHKLAERLPSATFVDATETLRLIRMVKTTAEIERLGASANLNERALQAMVAVAEAGASSQKLAAVFREFVTAAGGVPGLWTCPGGERSSGFFRPSDTPFREKDTVRFDVGCCLTSYWSDFGRTLCIGRPTDRLRERYAALREGYEAAVAMLAPGVLTADIFATAVHGIRAAGLPEFDRHHCGHGIGVEFYDPPMVAADDHTRLEEGMVINIEVPYYELGFGGIQLEDTFAITSTGARPLTRMSRDLVIA